MKFMKFFLIITLLLTLQACAGFRNQGVGVGKDGTVSAYNNLDRHGAIALFQSQEGKICYDTIKQAISYSLTQNQSESKPTRGGRSFVEGEATGTTAYDAIISQANAMAKLAKDSMKYAAHMVAYSNGITPQDPIVQLAALCRRTNYYDSQIAQSENRHETYRAIAAEVGSVLKTSSPYAALAYVGSKVGDRNDISGNNSAVGDSNAVSTPTVVEPEVVIVEPEVIEVEPEIVIVPAGE